MRGLANGHAVALDQDLACRVGRSRRSARHTVLPVRRRCRAQRIRAVRDSLQGCAQVYYAVKANPNLALLRALQGHADGVDISSAGELVQAQLAGFDGGCMSFAGPAKTATELEAAIRAGVGCYQHGIDS